VTEIASTATVARTAQVGPDVTIGPGCHIGAGAVIGAGCELMANVVIAQGVVLGQNNRIFPNAVLGADPQILSYEPSQTALVIGDENVFRENVTINGGLAHGGGKTVIGDRCYFMAGVHVGHDCQVEDQVVISNQSLLSGHAKVERQAWIGALCGMHQFTTVGRHAYIGGMSTLHRDIPPYMKAAGAYPCEIRGVNTIGLQRAGFDAGGIAALKDAYSQLYRRRNGKTFAESVRELAQADGADVHVCYLLEAVQNSMKHPLGRFLELARDELNE